MDYQSIGRNIRKRREAMGIKRETLAEMADLSVSYMSALERGEKLPSLDTFLRIVNALEASADELLTDVLIAGNRIVASELSQSLAALPAAEQRRILNVVATMLTDAQRRS